MSVDPITTYTCPLSEETHPIPSDEVRVMKSGDGDFVVACTCGKDSLEEADEQPHPTPDQFVNISANAPDPSEWLKLEDAAEGWYHEDPWTPPEGFTGTRAQRRTRIRKRAKKLADSAPKSIDGEHDERHETAREVRCPDCDANPGRKCQRPSGHRVRKCHSDRLEAAESAGVLEPESEEEDEDGPTDQTEQAPITGWSA